MIRAVILLGGPSKKASYGAYEQASQLFPIAGLEILSHLVYGISKLKNLKDLVLMGYYDYTHFQQFQESQHKLYGKPIIYVKEKQESGTAGGISKHLDELFHDVDDLLVIHSDICCDFNIQEIYDFHKTKNAETTLVTVKVNKEESTKFGCFIKDSKTDKMVHHAEKPEHYISDLVNCGIYLFHKSIKDAFEKAKIEKENNVSEELVQQPCMKFIKKSKDLDKNYLSIENDVLKLIHQVFLFQHQGFWKQIKNTSDLLVANSLLLESYTQVSLIYENTPYQLHENKVLIHKSAKVSSTAKLGPNVVIGSGCQIGDGVRIKNSIIQDGSEIQNYSYIENSILCYNSNVGYWCRIEGQVSFLAPWVVVDNELYLKDVICLQNRKVTQNSEAECIM